MAAQGEVTNIQNVLAIQNEKRTKIVQNNYEKESIVVWTETETHSFPVVTGAGAAAARAAAAPATIEVASLRTVRERVPSAGTP